MTKEKWDSIIEEGGINIEHLSMRVFDEDGLLQEQIAQLTFDIWSDLMKKPPRSPDSLAADVFYIVCKMTGNRVSVANMKLYTDMVYGKPLRVIPRSKITKSKWPVEEREKEIILRHLPDEEAYDDMVKEW
tara:strand:+ start:193 stop:585 length:393 start_codon:yes stop_codon:yes gene_type:complete